MKREAGYYWVMSNSGWALVEWNGNNWYITETINSVNDEFWEYINETRILPPDDINGMSMQGNDLLTARDMVDLYHKNADFAIELIKIIQGIYEKAKNGDDNGYEYKTNGAMSNGLHNALCRLGYRVVEVNHIVTIDRYIYTIHFI